MKKTFRFFDRMENKVRGFLSKYPIFYGAIAGIGLVLFWRGVWHTTDSLAEVVWGAADWYSTIDIYSSFWDGPISFVMGSGLLLLCGVFVSQLIGKEVIISGLRGEKKLSERTEVEVRTETGAIAEIRHELRTVLRRLDRMEKKMDEKSVSADIKIE